MYLSLWFWEFFNLEFCFCFLCPYIFQLQCFLSFLLVLLLALAVDPVTGIFLSLDMNPDVYIAKEGGERSADWNLAVAEHCCSLLLFILYTRMTDISMEVHLHFFLTSPMGWYGMSAVFAISPAQDYMSIIFLLAKKRQFCFNHISLCRHDRAFVSLGSCFCHTPCFSSIHLLLSCSLCSTLLVWFFLCVISSCQFHFEFGFPVRHPRVWWFAWSCCSRCRMIGRTSCLCVNIH